MPDGDCCIGEGNFDKLGEVDCSTCGCAFINEENEFELDPVTPKDDWESDCESLGFISFEISGRFKSNKFLEDSWSGIGSTESEDGNGISNNGSHGDGNWMGGGGIELSWHGGVGNGH